MKFRGKMIDGNCIKQFISILTTMSKLGKSCVLRITPTHMFFIVKEPQSITCSPVIWCTIEEGHFFSQYEMEGFSQIDNEILMEFVTENVSKTLSVLKVSTSAKSVKIKLTKKISPCLTFEVDLPTGSLHSRLIVHDIPVTIVPRRHWLEYQEPERPDPDVSVQLPQLRLVKNIVERMKNLASMATFHVTSQGSLTLTVETDTVSVTSHFEDLHVEKHNADGSTVTIELKRLSNFLTNEQLNPNRVICGVLMNSLVHINLVSDSYNLEFFLPGVST